MSTRRRWTRCRASLRRSASRVAPDRSSGRSASDGSSSASSERKASSLPLCGVAVTRMRWRSASLAERLEQFVALVAAAGGGAERERVGFVDDHELGAGADEVLAAAVGLDEVRRDDDVRVLLKERAGRRGRPRSSRLAVEGRTSSACEVELRPQLVLPLLGEVRRAEHGEALSVAAVEQLASDQRGLDGLADPDVVGDQQPHGLELERHQQRHELVGPRVDGDATERAERSGRGADAEPQRVAEQARAARVAGRRWDPAARTSPT